MANGLETVEKVINGLEMVLKYNITFDDSAEAIKQAITMLQDSRLTPRRPHHTKVEYKNAPHWITDECPRCMRNGLEIWDRLIDRHAPYCRRCGQALDWSEYDGDRKEIDWQEYMARKDMWEYGKPLL